MYFVCFCSSSKQCAAVELHTSVHLPRIVLAGWVVLLHPGNDLGEQCDGLGSLSLSFKKVGIVRNSYRHICGEEETLNYILGSVIFHHVIFPVI